ncbi:MAG: sodium:solute symporter [Fuerstiella sp.]
MIAVVSFHFIDWAVLLAYFAGMMMLGLFFYRKNKSADEFTSGGRRLPGWLCGLSIFATYLSSISYLALPGKSFVANWNFFLFSLALPFAAFVAVKWFVPLYRNSGEVSAYSLLEKRFGLWARIFASCFYLVFQIARSAVVMYLMALPMAVLFGWDIRILIVITGIVVTGYSFVGGIVAVIWADAIQAVVLLAGALLALTVLLSGMPEGITEVIELGHRDDKFSFGNASVRNVSESTIWVVLIFGLFDNIRNFGIDQSYVQRYIAAKSDSEAAKSVWLGALLYIPVSGLFFFMGTSLYAYYETHPEQTAEVRQIVTEQRLMQLGLNKDSADYQTEYDKVIASLEPKDLGDRVFPHFIAANLPVGLRGLLIAAIFAAAMSTVSTSLNSSATLVFSDFHQRLYRQESSDRQQVRILRSATVAWGLMGTLTALALVSLTESALDTWWTLSSVLGAGIVGLFLMGLLIPKLNSKAAAGIMAFGMLVIAWMTLSIASTWPSSWAAFRSPFHKFLIIVVGPLIMICAGWIVSVIVPRNTVPQNTVSQNTAPQNTKPKRNPND